MKGLLILATVLSYNLSGKFPTGPRSTPIVSARVLASGFPRTCCGLYIKWPHGYRAEVQIQRSGSGWVLVLNFLRLFGITFLR